LLTREGGGRFLIISATGFHRRRHSSPSARRFLFVIKEFSNIGSRGMIRQFSTREAPASARRHKTAAFSGLASSSASLIAHMGGDRGNAAELGHLKGEAAIW
jgi:hypothetical protein